MSLSSGRPPGRRRHAVVVQPSECAAAVAGKGSRPTWAFYNEPARCFLPGVPAADSAGADQSICTNSERDRPASLQTARFDILHEPRQRPPIAPPRDERAVPATISPRLTTKRNANYYPTINQESSQSTSLRER